MWSAAPRDPGLHHPHRHRSTAAPYVVLAPDHPLVRSVTTPARKAEVEAFAARMAAMPKIERTAEGAPRRKACSPGATPINPFTGQPVPIWVANFVLSGLRHRRA